MVWELIKFYFLVLLKFSPPSQKDMKGSGLDE